MKNLSSCASGRGNVPSVSTGFCVAITKNGSTYPIAEVVNVSATPVVVQSTTDLPAQNDGNLYVVLDNGYLYAWSNGWQQLYEYTSDLLTITEVTAGEVIYSYISDKGHSNRPIQVESAVRDGEGNIINETYAKKIGYEPRLSVGSADNINSDRQIDDPEASCPPTTMGITGGEAEIKTGIENFEYMEGNSEKFNQIAPKFATNGSWWKLNGGVTNWTYDTTNEELTCEATSVDYDAVGIFVGAERFVVGHKYFVSVDVKPDKAVTFQIQLGNWQETYLKELTANTYNRFELIGTQGASALTLYARVHTWGWSIGDTFKMKKPNIIDLTAIYGAGNEPTTVAEFKAKYPLDYYAYNAGEILSAKVAKLISRGRQQWDEETELGYIDETTGQNANDNNRLRSKNYIPIIGGQTYYVRTPMDGDNNRVIFPFFYDANHNYIGRYSKGSSATYFGNQTFVAPDNASYVRFYLQTGYGTTYHNDITISVYFADGEGYDKYYAYSAQEVTLPNIELRSIGDIKDIAYAQGGGKRRIGIVKLKDLNWTYVASWNGYNLFWVNLSAMKFALNVINARCSAYEEVTSNSFGDKKCYVNSGYISSAVSTVGISDSAYSDATTFKNHFGENDVLIYILDEETELTENEGWTEQVLVDNYGTLQFVTDPQQVPQVEQPYFIRYTIDLKEFLDGTYTHAQGDPQNLALKEDVETLKEDIERGDVKAGKSETADNLTPYSEDSGTTQTVPFINQGTGCGNGETQVDTGSLALMKNKQGNSKTINQYTRDFSDPNWGASGANLSISNGIASLTLTSLVNQEIYGKLDDVKNGHKYLCMAQVKSPRTSICRFVISAQDWSAYSVNNTTKLNTVNAWSYMTVIIDATFSYSSGTIHIYPTINASDDQEGDVIDIKGIAVIDLTQMFGSNDNIPAYLLAHPEAFFNYYQGSLAYNTGTLVNSNATKLKCIGRNVWNEEWEVGSIDGTTGQNTNDPCVRSKGYIPCMPNTDYYFDCRSSSGHNGVIFYYDVNKNYIYGESIDRYSRKTPANACYIRFRMNSEYGSTYKNDITVSLYYEDESGYDQYYPYEVLTETDTGNEVLRSAGSVRDYKEPNGTIHRLVGRYIFTGEETFLDRGTNQAGLQIYVVDITDLLKYKYSTNVQAISNKGLFLGINTGTTEVQGRSDPKGFSLYVQENFPTSKYIYFIGYTLQEIVGFILQAELEEETTEEGTPFAENVKVDDFGSMMWEGEGFNGVPMGAEIFYPIDYKAEMDTLHNHCNGDITSIVLASDLEASEQARDTVDAQLKNALGGTLRQCLCVKESLDFDDTDIFDLGDLSWSYDVTNSLFLALVSPSVAQKASSDTLPKILSTKYKTSNAKGSLANFPSTGKFVSYHVPSDNFRIVIRDNTYTDTALFKSAMKGVLLAYKKAS